MKAGAVVAAYRAGVPLYCVRVQASRARRFQRSWDKFLLPALFARVEVQISEPIHIPPDASREAISSVIAEAEAWMNTLPSSIAAHR